MKEALLYDALPAIATCIWFVGLWYTVGGLSANASIRLILAMSLTSAIGTFLAAINLFYGPMCWLALGGLVVTRRLQFPVEQSEGGNRRLPYALLVIAMVFIVWPSLVRPPLDGDTLIYHLPNAALWMRTHSLWHTSTHYWWYPEASEFFAATLMSALGLKVLPLAGAIALLALGFSVFDAAVLCTRSKAVASMVSLALISSHTAVVQGGDLQNDVCLAAFFVSLSFLKLPPNARVLIAGTLALIKPSGWVYSLLCALLGVNRSPKVAAAVILVITAWWGRNLLLSSSATVGFPSCQPSTLFSTSILAHGVAGISTLYTAATADDVSTLVFLIAACTLGIVRKQSRVIVLCVAIFWLISPYTFESGGIQQLAIGAALRFGLPLYAIGAISVCWLVDLVRKPKLYVLAKYATTVIFLALSAEQLRAFREIYITDSSTRFQLLAALTICISLSVSFAISRKRPNLSKGISVAFSLALLAYANHTLNQTSPARYYDAVYEKHGLRPKLAEELESLPEGPIFTEGLPAGIAVVMAPRAIVGDIGDAENPCGVVRNGGYAVLLDQQPSTDPYCDYLTIQNLTLIHSNLPGKLVR